MASTASLGLGSWSNIVATKQAAIAEQGQFTDRFTKAVDQLDRSGADHIQARLGAVYALERLAHDSSTDHKTVVNVIAAFVRTTAARPSLVDSTDGRLCPDQQVAADVQAALTVLGDPKTTRDVKVNLSRTCLIRANLTDGHFRGADFTEAVLDGSLMRRTALNSAILVRTNLYGVHLNGAQLRDNADLSGARLPKADLRDGTDLSGARHDDKTIVDHVKTDSSTRGIWW